MASRSAALLLGLSVLAGCMTPEPVTQDKDGRGVVSGTVAAQMFLDTCYASPSGAAVRANKSYDIKASSLEGSTIAEHRTLAANFVALDAGACSISFVGDKPAAESASMAAAVLAARLKVANVGGKRGGGQVSLATPKGTVIVGNGAKRHRNGFTIMLFGKKR